MPLATTWEMADVPDAVQRARTADPEMLAALQALGFRELTVLGNVLHGGAGDPELGAPDADDAEEVAWAERRARLETMFERLHLAWVGQHATEPDVVVLEHNDDGTWVTFYRLGADGTLIRTLRRPHALPPAPSNPYASAPYAQTRMPGLKRLVRWVAGDVFANGTGWKPAVRQFDRPIDVDTVSAAWARHQAHVAEVGMRAAPITPTGPMMAALSRRTMHVLEAHLGAASWWSTGLFALFVAMQVGVAAAWAHAAWGWSGAVLFVLPALSAATVTRWLLSRNDGVWMALFAWAPVVEVSSWFGVGRLEVAGVLLAATALAGAADLASLWAIKRGLTPLGRPMRTPRPVPATSLEDAYPPPDEPAPGAVAPAPAP